jgi:hypothetical protein
MADCSMNSSAYFSTGSMPAARSVSLGQPPILATKTAWQSLIARTIVSRLSSSPKPPWAVKIHSPVPDELRAGCAQLVNRKLLGVAGVLVDAAAAFGGHGDQDLHVAHFAGERLELSLARRDFRFAFVFDLRLIRLTRFGVVLSYSTSMAMILSVVNSALRSSPSRPTASARHCLQWRIMFISPSQPS